MTNKELIALANRCTAEARYMGVSLDQYRVRKFLVEIADALRARAQVKHEG